MRLELINTGTELLLGSTINTHLSWLGENLFPLGLRLARQLAIPDGDIIRQALLETGKVNAMPPYEDVIRPFVMDASKEFTDVWTFPSVRPYKGKHPAEELAALPATVQVFHVEQLRVPGLQAERCILWLRAKV